MNGSAACSECRRGKYSTGTAETSEATCITCPAHTYSGEGSSMLVNCTCNKGYTGADGGAECSACRAGTFKDVNGSTACVPCARGKYLESQGNKEESDCVRCLPGKFSTVVGAFRAVQCQNCAAGKYVELEGSDVETDCVQCTAGKFSTVVGAAKSAECQHCEAGKFSAALGAVEVSTCKFCDSGKYSNERGSSSCVTCPSGKKTNTPGAVAQSACAVCRNISTDSGAPTCKLEVLSPELAAALATAGTTIITTGVSAGVILSLASESAAVSASTMSLITQVQFLALSLKVGGSQGSPALATISDGLAWSRYRLPVKILPSNSSFITGMRRRETNECNWDAGLEAVETLVGCLIILSLVALARGMVAWVIVHILKREELLSLKFPAWEVRPHHGLCSVCLSVCLSVYMCTYRGRDG